MSNNVSEPSYTQHMRPAVRFLPCRLQRLDVSKGTYIESRHEGGLTSLTLDNNESRYLLASASDSSFAAYDTSISSLETSEEDPQCLFKIDRNSPDGHAFAVSSAIWYPVDTGLLVTGSADNTVKVCS